MTNGPAGPHVLLTPAEMARADALAIARGTPGSVLMENAGYAVADAVVTRHPQGTRVAVVCGPGNNGGDGFVAARVLAARGYVVRLGLLGAKSDLKGDAAQAASLWRGEVEAAGPALLERAAVIVDALFGAGLSRGLEGAAAAMVEAINAAGEAGATVVAVDLPSGIDGRTGAAPGPAVRATRSVTFFRRKPGHLLLPGRLHAGRVSVVDIGIPDAVLGEIAWNTVANGPDLWRARWPVPSPSHHKYSRGAVLVACGPVEASGAARLAAASALRAGAGLVTVAAPTPAVATVAAYRAAFVVKPCDDLAAFGALAAEARLRAMVLGPGLGVTPTTRGMLETVLSGPVPLVLDADALTVMAQDREAFVAHLRARAPATVLTPHEGEFARLFPAAGGCRLDRARTAAAECGAVVVLKGADTVIAGPDGFAAINENAPPHLATAGSGDVLAGIVAGLLAQGLSGFEAASMGVWMHGASGTVAGAGAIADDLVEALRPVLAAGCPSAEPGGDTRLAFAPFRDR